MQRCLKYSILNSPSCISLIARKYQQSNSTAIFGYVVLDDKSQIGLLEQSFKDQIWNRTLGELALERGTEAV